MLSRPTSPLHSQQQPSRRALPRTVARARRSVIKRVVHAGRFQRNLFPADDAQLLEPAVLKVDETVDDTRWPFARTWLTWKRSPTLSPTHSLFLGRRLSIVVAVIRHEGYLYCWSSRFGHIVAVKLPRRVDWWCRSTNDYEFTAIYCLPDGCCSSLRYWWRCCFRVN